MVNLGYLENYFLHIFHTFFTYFSPRRKRNAFGLVKKRLDSLLRLPAPRAGAGGGSLSDTTLPVRIVTNVPAQGCARVVGDA